MPNQLAQSKKRRSLTEHEAVLAALAEIAHDEGTTVMVLLRRAVRELIGKHAGDPVEAEKLRDIVMQFAPQPPERFRTPAELSRFKRSQREFDRILRELRLVAPDMLEYRNSAVSPRAEMHVLELEGDYVTGSGES